MWRQVEQAYERVGDPHDAGPFVFTCEHASNRVPPPLAASEADARLLAQHWGWDLGARELTLALVERLGGQAVLARFSRLVIDANRTADAPTLVLREVDGEPVGFNGDLDDGELRRRTRELFDAYHGAIDEVLARRLTLGPPARLVAIHSFTPLWQGRPRPTEVGVLFDEQGAVAARALCAELAARGFASALNQPYSGLPPDGLIESALRHGRKHGVAYLELEVRQDLLGGPDEVRDVASRIAAALEVVRP